MNDIMTINRFNRLTGQETLHPLVGIADLTADTLERDIDDTCDFFALLCYGGRLRLVLPGEPFRIPAAAHRLKEGYTGVLFHPTCCVARLSTGGCMTTPAGATAASRCARTREKPSQDASHR